MPTLYRNQRGTVTLAVLASVSGGNSIVSAGKLHEQGLKNVVTRTVSI